MRNDARGKHFDLLAVKDVRVLRRSSTQKDKFKIPGPPPPGNAEFFIFVDSEDLPT